MIVLGNFAGNPNPDVGGETEFRNCNFAQPAPVDVGGKMRGVRLFLGYDTPRTSTSCNLCNCEPPPGSTVIDSNTCIKTYYVETEAEKVTIDAEAIVLQHHADYIYGRWTPAGYEDNPSPIIVGVD